MGREMPSRGELLAFDGTKKELAEKYGVSVSTIYRWLKPRVFNEKGSAPRYRLEHTHKVWVTRVGDR